MSTTEAQYLNAGSWAHIFPKNKKKQVRFSLNTQLLAQGNTTIEVMESFGIKDSKGWRMGFLAEAYP